MMKQLTVAVGVAGVLAVSGCATSVQRQQDGRGIPEDARTVEGRFDKGPEPVPGVDAFGYEISIRNGPENQHRLQWQTIVLTVQATGMVSSEIGTSPVEVSQNIEAGLIDITAKKVDRPVQQLPNGAPPRMVPEKQFQIRLEALSFPTDRPVYLRLRFQDAEELFALTYQPDQGLRLVEIKNRFGKIKEPSIKEFAILETKEGTRLYQCDNLSIVARADQKDLWTRRIPLAGTPKEFRVVGETLFVLSTQGHSLYVRKNDGKIVFYHREVLAGKAPWDEILEVTVKAYGREGGPENGVLTEGIRAAALLEDNRAAPFLIECIEKGYGLVERWWAVAALEHLNGNSEHWLELRQGQSWDPRGDRGDRATKWDMNRVYPDAALKAEVQKWEKVFGKVEKPLLTGLKK